MKMITLFCLLFTAALSVSGQQVRDGINAAQFGLSEGKDATPVILKALDACYESGASRLTIPKGTYHFYPDYALEEYLAISGTANGLKRIAFPLINFENLIIDGSGSTFIMHGMMLPFEIQECHNIRIRNMTIRFSSPVWGGGIVTSVHQEGHFFTVKTDPKDSLDLDRGRWVQKRFPEKMAIQPAGWYYRDASGNGRFQPLHTHSSESWTVKPLQKGDFWLEPPPGELPKKTWRLLWKADDRELTAKIAPAFHISGSDGVTLSNVAVIHPSGMALIAGQSGNVMLDRLKIVPDTLAGQKIATMAGGIRFEGCRKQIVVSNCIFTGIVGNAVSVAGLTLKVVKRISNHQLGVCQINEKEWGSKFAEVSDTIRFSNPTQPDQYSERIVSRIRDLNEQYQEVWFDRALPEDVRTGTLLTNISRQPAVILNSNRVMNPKGDTFQLHTAGRIRVEGNHIWSGGHGIWLGGDVAPLYRPVMLNHVFLKNNTFRCNHSGKPHQSLILIAPAFPKPSGDTTFVHQDITLEGNTFYSEGKTVLDAVSTAGLVIRKNTIIDTRLSHTHCLVFRLRHCRKVGVVGNRYLNKQEARIEAERVDDLLFFDNEGIKAP